MRVETATAALRMKCKEIAWTNAENGPTTTVGQRHIEIERWECMRNPGRRTYAILT